MPSIVRRLVDLDRALYSRAATPEGWTKAMSAWRWALGCASFIGAVQVVLVLVALSRKLPVVTAASLGFTLPLVVLCAFRAGQMKAEYERITGDGTTKVLGRPRPPGV